jgi:predicted dehydrogenase
MKDKQKIKFAVVGLGHIGKRHAEMIIRNPDCELAATCDVLERSELNLQPEVNAPHYLDLQTMIQAHPEIDVVNVCTPNGLHAEQSIIALNAGKHVVCEKPMALNKAACEKMIHYALQQSKHVFVVKQNRFSPPNIWLKKIVEEKILGDIYLMQLNCYWNRDERYYQKGGWHGSKVLDGGTLFTQFSHFIDIMYWIFGDIHNISARFFNFNHAQLTEFEDSGVVHFDFLNGGSGVINYSTSVWDKNMESSLTVIGSNGSVKIGGQYMDKIEYCHIENYQIPQLPPTNPSNNYGAYKGSANNHPMVIQNVVDTLKNNQSPATNAMEGLKVVEIIEKIYQLK